MSMPFTIAHVIGAFIVGCMLVLLIALRVLEQFQDNGRRRK